jgi:hypothetical protein
MVVFICIRLLQSIKGQCVENGYKTRSRFGNFSRPFTMATWWVISSARRLCHCAVTAIILLYLFNYTFDKCLNNEWQKTLKPIKNA